MMHARHAACLIACVFAGACSSAPRWEKAGAAPETVAADLKQCEAAAPMRPRPPRGPSSKPASNLIDFDQMAEREGDRFLKDEKFVRECMRAKGYSD